MMDISKLFIISFGIGASAFTVSQCMNIADRNPVPTVPIDKGTPPPSLPKSSVPIKTQATPSNMSLNKSTRDDSIPSSPEKASGTSSKVLATCGHNGAASIFESEAQVPIGCHVSKTNAPPRDILKK
jgi:hypothetical protein